MIDIIINAIVAGEFIGVFILIIYCLGKGGKDDE